MDEIDKTVEILKNTMKLLGDVKLSEAVGRLEKKKGVDACMSFRAIMKIVDKHRPYEPSDFVKESFIPDI